MLRALLRSVRSVALVTWVGGLLFFALVLAPTAFGVLPTRHDAGVLVGASLRKLHVLGLGAGLLYLLTYLPGAAFKRRWLRVAAVVVMLGVTAYLQWGLLPQMDRDWDAAGGVIEAVAKNAPARMDFDRLHARSEQMEGFVLLLGLAVVAGTAWQERELREDTRSL